MGYENDFHIDPWIDVQGVKAELENEARNSLIPSRISDHGRTDEPLLEVIICDSISGGADYIRNMPRQLTLVRKLADGTEHRARYGILPDEVSPVQVEKTTS